MSEYCREKKREKQTSMTGQSLKCDRDDFTL